jgi:hypothetical protein
VVKKMSFEVMAWAVKQKTANSGQQLVLLLLANHTNGHTGRCNPSHRLLAEECRMGLSTLKNHVKGLEESGFLRIIHVSRDGVSLPNQYILEGVGQDLTEGQSESDGGVGQNLATKQEDKPVIKHKATAVAKPEGVSSEVWNSFVQHRKIKKAVLTPLVMDMLVEQAKIAGWPLESALKETVLRNWVSFKADWVAKKPDIHTQLTTAERLKRMAG